MPIDRTKYPPNWKEISKRIREEVADGRCQCLGECGVAHEHTDPFLTQRERCAELNGEPALHFRGRVVLTVAHLNHTPMDCRDENLRALCQRCHLRYDARHHAETRRNNRPVKEPLPCPSPKPRTASSTP